MDETPRMHDVIFLGILLVPGLREQRGQAWKKPPFFQREHGISNYCRERKGCGKRRERRRGAANVTRPASLVRINQCHESDL